MSARHCVPGFFLTACLAFAGEKFPDAAKIIAEIQQAAQAGATDAGDSDQARWNRALTDYAARSATLSPEEAARQWLDLVRQWKALPNSVSSYGPRSAGSFDALVEAIPPPAAWAAIQAQTAGKGFGDPLPDALLALYAATLNQDESAQWKAFAEVQKMAGAKSAGSLVMSSLARLMGGSDADDWLQGLTANLAEALASLSADPAHVLESLAIQLKIRSKMEDSPSLTVPDLATIAGEAKAREFLKKALAAPVELEVRGRPTQKLARELALENIARLAKPQWSLVNGIDEPNLKLYAALAKKFGTPAEPNYEQQTASGFYLLGLIARGDTDLAARLVPEMARDENWDLPYNGLNAMRAAGYGQSVYEFLRGVLEKNPDLPLWGDFLQVAADQRLTAAAIELAQKALERPQLDDASRLKVLSQLASAYLAHGDAARGVERLRERLALLKKTTPVDYSEVNEIAGDLLALGPLLADPALTEEGIREALEAQARSEDSSPSAALYSALLAADRPQEAQKLAAQAIQRRVKTQSEYSRSELAAELTMLAGLYDAAGQSADVLVLLTEAPWWGAEDLSAVVEKRDFRNVPLGVMAARAFLAGGDKEQARKVLEATIRRLPSNDTAYAMLVEIAGAGAMPFLDAQFAADRFQERPLIWKAGLELRAGDLAAAEKTIRAAIAIDPSDGEMGAGDRMRAYAVLADVLEAQDRPEDAKIYRGAVAAIRLSEEADKYQRAGLLSQAVAKYEEALLLFADAYCIQSRLAIQFMRLGDLRKAEAHYLKAYELMPDSFGRVESHCFGCERAFAGELAETLAEKTFKRLLAENPGKPQLQYLLGYLRYEQERYPEALEHFRKAVELDPDYLNAWKKILDVDSDIAISPALRDEATLAILRLDPLSRHSRAELEKITDIKAAWKLIEELRAQIAPEAPETLLPLTASKTDSEGSRQRTYYASRFRQSGMLPKPADLLIQQVVLRPVSETLTQLKQMNRP